MASENAVVRAVRACLEEAHDERGWRLSRNADNNDAYYGRQDWSGKIPGQSREFLPKTANAVDRMAASVRQALLGGDAWSIKYPEMAPERLANSLLQSFEGQKPDYNPEEFLSQKAAKTLLQFELGNMASKSRTFSELVSAAVKLASIEASCFIKVGGQPVKLRTIPGKKAKRMSWRLALDLIPIQDIYLDPTGADAYLIHSYEVDYYEVKRLADAGIYNKAAVKRLQPQQKPDDERRVNQETGGNGDKLRAERHRVIITEFYGNLIGTNGELLIEDGYCVLGNNCEELVSPMDCPHWHGERPFIQIAPLKTPLGIYHKALIDEASQLNFALNETFNLMIDGGMSAVWGIRQLREDFLEDPRQVADGIPQGETLVVNQNLPMGEKVLEIVASGQIPPETFAIYQSLGQEFAQAAYSNELRTGQTANKNMSATEINEQAGAQNTYLADTLTGLENEALVPLLRMAFTTIIEHVGEIDFEELEDLVGTDAARKLQDTRKYIPEALFDAFSLADFEVTGIKRQAEAGRQAQRIAQAMQLAASVLGPAGQLLAPVRMSANKLFVEALRSIGLNPEDYAMAQEEQQAIAQQGQATQQMGPQQQKQGAELPRPGTEPNPPVNPVKVAAQSGSVQQMAQQNTGRYN